MLHYGYKFCESYRINHKLIRPITPRHNGKVERSHKNDQERFYNFLSFYSFDDLKIQITDICVDQTESRWHPNHVRYD